MSFGAGSLAASRFGARELADPKPYAVGSIDRTFTDYPHIGPVLPAVGYGVQQMAELEETIRRVPCDLVVIATPVDLRRVIQIQQPTCRVTYEFQEIGTPTLRDVLHPIIEKAKPQARANSE